MKCKKKILIFSLGIVAHISYALTPANGTYGGVIIGGSYIFPVNIYPTDNILDSTYASNSTFSSYVQGLNPHPLTTLTYSFMGLLGAELGYRLDKFRVEGQFLYNSGKYDSLQYNGVKITSNSNKPVYLSGQSNIYGGLLNVFYDLLPPPNIEANVVPFVGLGIGYVTIQNNLYVYTNPNADTAPNTGTRISPDSILPSTNSAAGQLIAGVSYYLDDFSYFSLDCRLFSTANISQTYAYGNDSIRYQFISGNLSFNGSFNLG